MELRRFAAIAIASLMFGNLKAEDQNINQSSLPFFDGSAQSALKPLLDHAIRSVEYSPERLSGQWLKQSDDRSSSDPRIPLLPLDPPTGLRVAVYSDSALELFWDRVTDKTLSYEVRQDTRSIGFTDGTSFFIADGVEPGVEYTFEVIARFDNQPGVQISESAKISVSLGGDPDGGVTPPDPDPENNGPDAPSNFTIAQYSSSAAELFWDRAPADAQIVSYDIFRNGEFLGSTNGTSFMDWSRTENQFYEYAIVAIDANGLRSSETLLIDGGPDPDEPEPPVFYVEESNLNEVLESFAAITRGEPVAPLFEIAEGLLFGDFDDLLRFEQTEPDGPFRQTTETFACSNGGSLIRTFTDLGDASTTDVSVDNCLLQDILVSGRIMADQGTAYSQIIDDLVITIADSDIFKVSSYFFTGNTDDNFRVLTANYQEIDALNGQTLVDYLYEGIGSDLSFEASWTATSFINEFPSISASTETVFFAQLDDADDFSMGSLRVDIDNGQSVTIDAANGDISSFSVLVAEGDAVNSYTAEWNDFNRLFIAVGKTD